MSEVVESKDMMDDGFFDSDELEIPSEEYDEAIDGVDEEATPVEGTVVESKREDNQIALGGGLNLDLSGFGSLPGVAVGDVGLTVNRFPVERAKFTKDSRALIHIVSDKVVAIKTHYREGLGNYLCFGGECCEHDGLPRVKYLFPINVYDTNKKGKPISAEMQYKVLSIGADQYEDLVAMQELNGSLTGYDILVSCKDEQYQKLSFQMVNGPARCTTNPKWKETNKQANQFWTENFKHIVKSSARMITKQELLKDINESVGPIQDDVDFDAVFDN